MDIDLKVGDVVLGGKFKNKRIVVKTIGKDDLGQPTINGRSMLNFRIEKNLPKDKQSKETREGSDTVKKESTTITKSQLRKLIKETLSEMQGKQDTAWKYKVWDIEWDLDSEDDEGNFDQAMAPWGTEKEYYGTVMASDRDMAEERAIDEVSEQSGWLIIGAQIKLKEIK